MSEEYAALKAWVAARADRNEETGCLVWRLAGAHGGKEPQGTYMGKVILIRRAIYAATRKKPLATTQTVKCRKGECFCVEESHLVAKQRVGKKGQKVTPITRARIAQAWRKDGRLKVSDEALADITSRSEPRQVYADRYGISQEYVSDLQGRRMRTNWASPFNGLGARG